VGDSEIDRRTAERPISDLSLIKNPRISNGCLIPGSSGNSEFARLIYPSPSSPPPLPPSRGRRRKKGRLIIERGNLREAADEKQLRRSSTLHPFIIFGSSPIYVENKSVGVRVSVNNLLN